MQEILGDEALGVVLMDGRMGVPSPELEQHKKILASMATCSQDFAKASQMNVLRR